MLDFVLLYDFAHRGTSCGGGGSKLRIRHLVTKRTSCELEFPFCLEINAIALGNNFDAQTNQLTLVEGRKIG